jgi:formylglycine-generating enzyme required for sulfatase activity
VREIGRSGVSLDDVTEPRTVRAFLGPTNPRELSTLPGLTEKQDGEKGSGRYGDAWQLPLSHEARASVGVRLARLGDRRKGVGLRADGLPDIEWCRVEGGDVTIYFPTSPDDPPFKVNKPLRRPVALFWMARYPVTITQFQAFLGECYPAGRWQLPPGFPMDFAAADWPPPKHRSCHGNHPVDSVNWFDAYAFCHWLSARLGDEVRLPTEFEWQLAANGGDPLRTFPWGADWDPGRETWRANTIESGLGRSTAVGMYPDGASPLDILDMAGTLWEWCQNSFDYPNRTAFPASQEDPRALRGGSWDHDQVVARTVDRSSARPILRNASVGFRVVCSSPFSGTGS